jgi:hypothetical protein
MPSARSDQATAGPASSADASDQGQPVGPRPGRDGQVDLGVDVAVVAQPGGTGHARPEGSRPSLLNSADKIRRWRSLISR